VRQELVEREAADVRAELLVEKVFELERATACRLVARVERRLRILLFERFDDAPSR
jgi:hypothetical protein